MEYTAESTMDYMKPAPVNKDDWRFMYTPQYIIDEYNTRWSNTPKISFEEFYREAVKLGRWYSDNNNIAENYDEYIVGQPNSRYPKLPIRPEQVLLKVIKEFEDIYTINQ